RCFGCDRQCFGRVRPPSLRFGATDRYRQKTSVERQLQIAVLGHDRVVHGHELGAVRERAFDLDLVHQFRYAVQHLRASEELSSQIHELRDAASVADELENLSRDERDGLRMVQSQAACEALLREKAGLMKRELVEFMRSEVHIN